MTKMTTEEAFIKVLQMHGIQRNGGIKTLKPLAAAKPNPKDDATKISISFI